MRTDLQAEVAERITPLGCMPVDAEIVPDLAEDIAERHRGLNDDLDDVLALRCACL